MRKFDAGLAGEIGLSPGKKRIIIKFYISKEGEVVNISTKAPHPKLIDEANRVINSLSKFISPAYSMGKPINTSYTFPVMFNVE